MKQQRMMGNTTMVNKRVSWIAAIAMAFSMSAVWAQDPAAVPVEKADEMEAMPGMDHGGHGSTSAAEDGMSEEIPMNHGDATASKNDDMSNMNHGGSGMDHGSMSMSMQGGSAPSDARDPHAYSGGYTLDPARPLKLADEYNFGSLRFDRLESVRTRGNSSTAYDLQAWFGRDYDRLVLKAEGDIYNGELQDAHTDLLWGHAVAVYWDTQLGVRYDTGTGSDQRGWLAFGVQGLAPYWFEVDIAAYVSTEGRTALRLEADYELLLTQKLILQPRVEANLYGKRDAGRALGSGLSDVSVGLRLRYEIRREIAPYIGVEWASKFGGTADYVRDAGQETAEVRAVAGVRLWF